MVFLHDQESDNLQTGEWRKDFLNGGMCFSLDLATFHHFVESLFITGAEANPMEGLDTGKPMYVKIAFLNESKLFSSTLAPNLCCCKWYCKEVDDGRECRLPCVFRA